MNRQAERDWSLVVLPTAFLTAAAILSGFACGAVVDRWLDAIVHVLSRGGVVF